MKTVSPLCRLSLVAAWICLVVGYPCYGRDVENLTKAFKVVESQETANAEQHLTTVRLRLKNEYPTNIVGFFIGFPGKSGPEAIMRDYLITDAPVIGIAPQAEIVLPVQVMDEAVGPVLVKAVVLEDGTSEGDPDAIAALKQRWSGLAMQMERAASIVKELKASQAAKPGPVNWETVAETLTARDPKMRLPNYNYRAGMQTANTILYSEVDKVARAPKTGALSDSELLDGLARRIAEVLARVEKVK